MIKRYAPPVPDPSYFRAKDTPYFLELLRVAGLTQRAAGPAIGLSERSVRNRVAHDSWSYPEQYVLEKLADAKLAAQAGVQESAPAYGDEQHAPTIWHIATERPLQRHDVGKLIVAKDAHGVKFCGELAADGFGLVIRVSEGLDVRKVPVERVAVYALLDAPPSVGGK